MPDTLDASALRRRLVDSMRRRGALRSRRVEQGFLAVPREIFLPGLPLEEVYADRSIAIKTCGDEVLSSSSQPSMMAIMLEQLAVREGDRILEIGTGTGYNAAILASLTGPNGSVTSVDIDAELIEAARPRFDALGGSVTLVAADAEELRECEASYDAIIVTVSAAEVSPDWFAALREGGRLVVPLELGALQLCVAFERKGAVLKSRSCAGTAFIRLRGAARHIGYSSRSGEVPFTLRAMHPGAPSAAEAWRLLCEGPRSDRAAGIGFGDLDGASHWLDLRGPYLCLLAAVGKAAEQGIVPSVMGRDAGADSAITFGYAETDGLALFALRPTAEVRILGFGAPAPAVRLVDDLAAWASAGRPSLERLAIRIDFGPPAPRESGELVLRRPRSAIVVRWT